MKHFLKDKRGMSLMELVVALTLLALVIVGTTPIMLSSYEGLYNAGQFTKDTYEAKSEIEDSLAKRTSLDFYNGFKVNFQNLGEVATVNGKRAVSSLYGSLESLFVGGRAHVAIVSSDVINDDYLKKEITIQTTNIGFSSMNDFSTNDPSTIKDKQKLVDITVMKPDKTSENLAEIYRIGNVGKATILDINPNTGRIKLEIQEVDFTTSPVKIVVTYRDENDKVKSVGTYLTIKTPTIMLAGTTVNGHYYTTEGVVDYTDTDGVSKKSFDVDARKMRIKNTVSRRSYGFADIDNVYIDEGAKEVPLNTIFKNITWIDNDDVTGQVEPYYVLTGNQGSIYRTYSFTGINAELMNVVKPDDKIFTLDDSASTVVYPAVWGGDYSHQFGYSTHDKSMEYSAKGNDTAWYTGDGGNQGLENSQARAYATQTTLAYYYNGWGMTYKYRSQKRRAVSYILTEHGYSLRLGGHMQWFDNYGQGYNRIWEITDGDHLGVDNGHKIGYSSAFNNQVPSILFRRRNSGADAWTVEYFPYYLGDRASNESTFRDACFAQINLKYLSTLSEDFVYPDVYDTSHITGALRWNEDERQSDTVWLNSEVDNSNVNVTDAVFIPYAPIDGVSDEYNATGKVLYVGSVAAYGYINQIDNLGPNSDWAKNVYSKLSDNYGRTSCYYFIGSDDGLTTRAYKFSIDSGSDDYSDPDFKTVLPLFTYINSNRTPNEIKTNTNAAREFYVTRLNAQAKGNTFTDLCFTLGYASNRTIMFSEVAYGRQSDGSVRENHKSYEAYYYQSHYGDKSHQPTYFMNNLNTDYNGSLTNEYRNSVNNDYYNVWMPGEMYNLTKIASKDGVTVAVGYAVSGSTFQFTNPNQASNTSTALGGLHNDGVLAVLVSGKDSAFQNLLYFKDNTSADLTSLSSGSVSYYSGTSNYKNLWGDQTMNYGTHARTSVQFLCVDIGIEYTESGSTENAVYYAYYADNTGRLFKSKIATKSSVAGTEGTPESVPYITDQPVNAVPTESYSQYKAPTEACGKMDEMKVNGNSLSYYFSRVTSIKCEGDNVIVTGYPNPDRGAVYVVLGEVKPNADRTANETVFRAVQVAVMDSDSGMQTTLDTSYQAETSLILDGYVYFAGTRKGSTGGFVAAISLDELKKNARSNIVVGYCDYTTDKLYAMDGHK